MNNRYLIQHKKCGALLLKTDTAIFFNTQIKCPNCKEIVNIPEDIIITSEEKKCPGIESGR